MEKKKLLYASPFPPQKSGISDYSEILAEALSERFDITLFIDDYMPSGKGCERYRIVRHNRDAIEFESYDYIIYNIGNNPEFHSYMYDVCKRHPGLIILHDFVLYYLFVGYYKNINKIYSGIYEWSGVDDFLRVKRAVKENGPDLLAQKKLASQLPLNKELLQTDNKIMVHSQYAYDRVKQYTNRVRIIPMIQQVSKNFRLIERETLLKKYKIPENAFIISSFGLIAETKLNHVMCGLVEKIAQRTSRKICYVMVGEGGYVDEYVDHRSIFKTGYVGMDVFDSFIAHSDMILNLRHPSMGETSAALIKILQMGKPCVIVDEAWFSEIPDNCAVKLPVEDISVRLEEKLIEYIEDDAKRDALGQSAAQYIWREYAQDRIVDEIEKFLQE